MISYFDVSKLLRDYLGAMPSVPDIATDGKQYTPVSGTPYLKEKDLSGVASPFTLKKNTETLGGVYQVDVYTPRNQGKFANLALSDKVKTHFQAITALTLNSTRIRVSSIDKSPLRYDGDFAITSLSINYMAHNIS